MSVGPVGCIELIDLRSTPDTSSMTPRRGDVNIAALVAVIAFYLVIFLIGVFATWKSKTWKTTNSVNVMLANRDIGIVVGIFTMTATWVGGGYINGTAEVLFTPGKGLIWCQAPIAYSLSICIGGMLFTKKMRESNYVTMLDPFEQRYGRVMAALLYIPALLGDVFYSAAILSALGATLTVIVGLDDKWAIIISASVALLYTIAGGLYSVILTDVFQLIFIVGGLWFAIPFAWTNSAVSSILDTSRGVNNTWIGSWPEGKQIWPYLDTLIMMLFGGIPWQAYFQRVLSQKTPRRAQILSLVAGLGCIVMAVPAVLIGAIAKSTDWNATDYRYHGEVPIPVENYKLVLPLVLQYLTPLPVAIIGLGAVSAAVMSSVDSSMLSSSSMFARHVYLPVRNACSVRSDGEEYQTPEKEILCVLRCGIVVEGATATVLAIVVHSIYGLFELCSDFVFVILFPQLFCVFYVPMSNSYGSLFGFLSGAILRLSGGEPLLGLPTLIKYPIAFKTLVMLVSFGSIVYISYVAQVMFRAGWMSPRTDVFKCFYVGDDDTKNKTTETLEHGESNLANSEDGDRCSEI
ncbi:High-affinity choline transporter 1 [Lamellibrachia satsuma]|nr:High-affinity choline transporter 1 [Lamellibrachia satsuma]